MTRRSDQPGAGASGAAPLRAAVVGSGGIAREHLACLGALPEAEVVSVCDLSAAMAESTADRFGVGHWCRDYEAMLEALRPDVVHVTTPAPTHARIAADCLRAGCHVVVEKPIAAGAAEAAALTALARDRGRRLVEDHNYRFNRPVRRVLELIDSGRFGAVVQMEAMICLDILAPGSAFADPDAPHAALGMPGGAIGDFLPHLAYLAHAFLGPHREVESIWRSGPETGRVRANEFRALISAERGLATLAFSARGQPDLFSVRVYGTKMRAEMSLFEGRLVLHRLLGGPRPLMPLRNGLRAGWTMGRAACGDLIGKLRGEAGAYEGLHELLGRTYRSIRKGSEPPVTLETIEAVARLVEDLARGGGEEARS